MCTEVSRESDASINLLENVQSSIEDAPKNSIPGLVAALFVIMKAIIKEIVKQALSNIDYEIVQTVRREFSD